MRFPGSAGLAVLLVVLACPAAAGAKTPAARAAQDPQPAATSDPAPAAEATDPFAGLRANEQIARRYGPRRAKLSFMVSTSGIPSGVDDERFVAMAETQGERWGLGADGVTLETVSLRNQQSEVGFSTRVPDGILGVYYRRVQYRYQRIVRCRTRAGRSRRSCFTITRKVGATITDRDIVLNPSVPWELGPAWPDADEFDLQTVLIHEFGHFAGNDQHDPACSVSPMTPSLSPGDWWRSTLDHRVVCRKGARAAAGRRPPRLRLLHRDIVSRVYERHVAGNLRAG